MQIKVQRDRWPILALWLIGTGNNWKVTSDVEWCWILNRSRCWNVFTEVAFMNWCDWYECYAINLLDKINQIGLVNVQKYGCSIEILEMEWFWNIISIDFYQDCFRHDKMSDRKVFSDKKNSYVKHVWI